jgi:prepilin-type N-terminal cleavage/methylation domain-containing protein
MKKAFTLIEILIVVAILGILAAIVLPTFKGHMTEAKESAAKDNLRILRNAIELYAAQHNGVPPGYAANDPSNTPVYVFFIGQLVLREHYLSELPENPFNGKCITKMIANNEDFPTAPVMTDVCGWIYKPATKTIKLNWQGTDPAGTSYFDY